MYRDSKEAQIEYLNNQIDDMRAQQERDREQNYRREKERREQRRAEWQEAQLHADDWADGFRKGLPRVRAEAQAEARDNELARSDPEMPQSMYDFFAQLSAKWERAAVIYGEEAKAALSKIARLNALIEKIEENIRLKAADRIEAESGDPGMIQALRDDHPSYLTDW